jgi:hypothetical protein
MRAGLLVLMAGGALATTPVEAGDGIAFLDSRELVVVMALNEQQATVGIDVLTAGEDTITLQLIDVVDSNGRPVSSATLVATNPPPLTKSKGQIARFSLVVNRPPQPGTYSGQIVAYTGNGTLISRGFKLVAEELAALPAAIHPEFLEQITMTGVNWGLAQIHLGSWTLDWSNVKVQPAPLLSAYPPDGTLLGSVSGNGGIGLVEKAKAGIAVDGLKKAGEYAGKIVLRPGGAGGQANLTVRIRDMILWALILLGLGLLASIRVDRWFTKTRPKLRLKMGIRELEEVALQKQDEEVKVRTGKYSGEPLGNDVYRIYKENPEGGLLAAAAVDLLRKFDESESDEERKKWGPGGDELQRLSEYPAKLEKMYVTSRSIADDYLALLAVVTDFDRLPVSTTTKKALSPRLIADEAKFAELQDELTGAAAFIHPFRVLYVRIEELIGRYPLEKRVEAKRGALASPAIQTAEQVTSLATEVEQLATSLGARAIRVFTPREYVNLRSEPMEGLLARADLDAPVLSWLNLGAAPDHLSPVPPPRPATSDELKKNLKAQDVQFQTVAVFVALITGIWTLYLPNATFGATLADYIGIFLWGLGIDQALKLVRRLGPGLAQKVVGS